MKLIVPNNDPDRLARIMDEKKRMFGVDKAALDAQVRERREREAAEAATARAAAQAAADHESTVQQRAVAAMEARRAKYKGTDAFRHEQQEALQQAEAEGRARDAAAGAAEQAAALASPWLNEAPQTTVSALAPHRWRPDHFKGLAPEQRAAIVATQAEQVRAKLAAQAVAAAQTAAHDAAQASHAAATQRSAAAAEAERRRQAAEVAAEQRRQAAEAAAREAERAAFLNSQQPTPDYFSQWGTSHR